MHTDIYYLTLEQLLVIHKDQIQRYGGMKGIKSLALLESAVYRPQSIFNGNDLYPTCFEKATAFVHSLITNHPFHDGNKRTGIVAMILFLKINSVSLQINDFELLSLARDIAENKITLKAIVAWMKNHES